ncbi:hypothetical protein TanjilG_05861 [Lupinus angustifolius]|uniref:GH18 domain-containing protein n=1 Tax=Lupinus angustifolius TaxID=3871 RepID=A0A4P1RDN9_LUPAN|nr:PREDICTED: chitinase 1-like [Lupinus angustifolius]OIW08886.1 hypothetical protein TanjilG_05861 [Lupinus angustifolius]
MSLKPIIFREYIGSKDGSKHLNFPVHIINNKVKEFHFILAFAKESYQNNKGSGIFTASWDLTAFNLESIKNLKKDHPNVKVIVSIGGPKDVTLFNIDERNAWLSNATKSLTDIISHYNIDGIDINYETILSNIDDFVFCIGGLINQLKEEKIITLASIAPSEAVHSHYNLLFNAYKKYIDWVDYKFYGHFLPSKEQFKELYNKLSSDYPSVLLGQITVMFSTLARS